MTGGSRRQQLLGRRRLLPGQGLGERRLPERLEAFLFRKTRDLSHLALQRVETPGVELRDARRDAPEAGLLLWRQGAYLVPTRQKLGPLVFRSASKGGIDVDETLPVGGRQAAPVREPSVERLL